MIEENKLSGFSLIELIVFIVITGLAVAAMMTTFQVVLQKSPNANNQNTAVELAQGRMDLILGQEKQMGFSSFSDPCTGGSPPSYCTLSSAYTVSSNIAVLSGNSNFKTITVTVRNASNTLLATLTAMVGA